MTSVRTTVGPAGVVVRYGVLGLPRFRYPIGEDLARRGRRRADLGDGRLGHHWSPWRGTRLTIRSGPSLRLQLRTGKQVVISAEDPATAAAVVNRYCERAAHV